MSNMITKHPIKIKNREFGGGQPLICVPLILRNEENVALETQYLVDKNPDVVEWRADYFVSQSASSIINTLNIIKDVLDDIPLVFTLRSSQEGGQGMWSLEKRLEVISKVLQTGYVDLIDIEQDNPLSFIRSIKTLANTAGCPLILSYHNFEKTPTKNWILKKMKRAIRLGADIPKLAFMPHNGGDVLTLMNATYEAKEKFIFGPLVTVSMGMQGLSSRIVGDLFGSDMTFALGKKSSAPGQIEIENLRKIMTILELVCSNSKCNDRGLFLA